MNPLSVSVEVFVPDTTYKWVHFLTPWTCLSQHHVQVGPTLAVRAPSVWHTCPMSLYSGCTGPHPWTRQAVLASPVPEHVGGSTFWQPWALALWCLLSRPGRAPRSGTAGSWAVHLASHPQRERSHSYHPCRLVIFLSFKIPAMLVGARWYLVGFLCGFPW